MAGIKVKFDEDGEAYVDEQDLAVATRPYAQKINQLEQALIQSQQRNDHNRNAKNTVDNILAEKDSYKKASKVMGDARAWINDVIIAFQNENGIGGTIAPADALKLLKGTEVEKEFKEEFGDVDLMDVIFSGTDEFQYKRGLDSIDKVLADKEIEDYRTKTVEGAIESKTPLEILDLEDDTIEKLMEKMREEELDSYK